MNNDRDDFDETTVVIMAKLHLLRWSEVTYSGGVCAPVKAAASSSNDVTSSIRLRRLTQHRDDATRRRRRAPEVTMTLNVTCLRQGCAGGESVTSASDVSAAASDPSRAVRDDVMDGWGGIMSWRQQVSSHASWAMSETETPPPLPPPPPPPVFARCRAVKPCTGVKYAPVTQHGT